MVDVEEKELIKIANELGYILSSEALSMLSRYSKSLSIDDFKSFLLRQDKILIRASDLEPLLSSMTTTDEEDIEIEERIHVIYDPGSISKGGSGKKDYESLLRDRYSQLVQKIRRVIKINDFVRISDIMSKKYRNNEVLLTGLLYRKRILPNRIIVEIEDVTGSIVAYLYKDNNPRLYEQLVRTPLDVVIGIKAFVNSKGRAIISDIFTPKVRGRHKERKGGWKDIYALLISDLHVGSKYFDEDLFNSFIDLLRGSADNEELKKRMKRVKYVVIAGDLVDGVGVYKNQEQDLEIFDIYEQYNKAYKLLKKIPSKIKIIVIPGNHDASRSSLPQPPIFKKFASKFYDDNQFMLLGNPVNISLHDVNMLIYHGDFVQDVLSSIPGMTQDNIGAAVKVLLDYSHLAPQIGLSTKIAPEPKDHLVIRDGISLLHFGHTHRFDISKIYGVLCVNSGTFQQQTRYQKMMKIEPDLGKIALIELYSLQPFMIRISE